MTYTVHEIQTGTDGELQIDLSGYAKKNEVSTIIDLDGLKKTIGNKLDRTPEHTHSITAIDDLSNQLNDKLSKSRIYSLNELIDTTSTGTLTDLNISNSLKITPSNNTNISLIIEAKEDKIYFNVKNGTQEQSLMYYDTDNSTLYINGIAFDKFVTDTNAVLKNHYDAIKIIAEKLELNETQATESNN